MILYVRFLDVSGARNCLIIDTGAINLVDKTFGKSRSQRLIRQSERFYPSKRKSRCKHPAWIEVRGCCVLMEVSPCPFDHPLARTS